MQISKYTTVKGNKIDFPMTRERYLSTWKIFRSISNENEITAKHILSLDIWSNINSILDLGCGDGLITKSIIVNSKENIDKVIFVDPDKEMLDEACLHLAEIGVVPDIQNNLSGFENCIDQYVSNVDIVLAVHLVYLITPQAFQILMHSLPVGKKLILVLDDEKSIFTRLWKRTAPKYVDRSAHVRHYLNTVSNKYLIKRSTITSKIINPLTQRPNIKEALLSIMCYSDYSLMDKTSKSFVDGCITENLSGGYVDCPSACYEITKIM